MTHYARLSPSLAWHVVAHDEGENRVRTGCGGILIRPPFTSDARPSDNVCRQCEESLQP